MVPLVPCTHDDVPRLIVKVQYPQICVPVSETDLDDLLRQLREASYYIISLRDFKPYTYIYRRITSSFTCMLPKTSFLYGYNYI